MKSARPPEGKTSAPRHGDFNPTRDLFDNAPVPLGIWPSAASLEGRFLARLLRGGELTAADWLGDAHSMRLSAEVLELRELGWAVLSERLTVRTRDRGRLAHVARYALEPHQCAAAAQSERGRHFLAAVDATERR